MTPTPLTIVSFMLVLVAAVGLYIAFTAWLLDLLGQRAQLLELERQAERARVGGWPLFDPASDAGQAAEKITTDTPTTPVLESS